MKLQKHISYKKCGIYCIINKANGKKYIGKSVNIYRRIREHINKLNKSSKDENQYFINSWKKYGRNNFYYEILEYCEPNNSLLKNKELYYIKLYNTTDRNFGYNIRMDSSTGIIISEETRKKLSLAQKERYKNPEERKKLSIQSKKYWSNPDNRKQVSILVSKVKQKYKFHQLEKNGNYIKTYDTIKEIIQKNPSYKWQNIYAVCNGYKPSYMGYVWKKELKI
jgi:group I intron endonuclease